MKIDTLLEAAPKSKINKSKPVSSATKKPVVKATNKIVEPEVTAKIEEEPVVTSDKLFYDILNIMYKNISLDPTDGIPKLNYDKAILDIQQLPNTNSLSLLKTARLLQQTTENMERFLLKFKKSITV